MARGTRQTKAPTATHVVEYKQKETGTRHLVGRRHRHLVKRSTVNHSGGFCYVLENE